LIGCPEFGPQTIGLTTEARSRGVIQVKMAVNIRWGGFAADGTLIMSDQNFRRFFDPQSDQPGADQTERGRMPCR